MHNGSGLNAAIRGVEQMSGLQSEIRESAKTESNSRILRGLAWLAALGGSIFFPGLGFLIYIAAAKVLGSNKKVLFVILTIIELSQLLTALGTNFGPLVSHVGPPIRE
jgi:glycopeptide antibiotics resistance protein